MKRTALIAALIVGATTIAGRFAHAKHPERTAVEVGPGIQPPAAGGVIVLPTPDGVPAADAHATVTIRLLVDKHGATRESTAVDAPDPILGREAAAVFARNQGRPATQDGKPIAVWWNRKVRFRPKTELDAEVPPPDCVAAAVDRLRDEELTDDVELPRLLQNAMAEYPDDALSDRDSGRAQVRCVLDTCGRVRDCNVVFATRASFGRATREAAVQRRYAPARKDGQPIAIELTISSNFYGP